MHTARLYPQGNAHPTLLGLLPCHRRVNADMSRPQAMCICPTRELVIQNTGVLQKMAARTDPPILVRNTAEQEERIRGQRPPPISEHIIIGTPGTLENWISRRRLPLDGMQVRPWPSVTALNRGGSRAMGFDLAASILLRGSRSCKRGSCNAQPPQPRQRSCSTACAVPHRPCTLQNCKSTMHSARVWLQVLVFDEADTMLMTEGFKDVSFRMLSAIRKASPDVQILLFSATFNERVREYCNKARSPCLDAAGGARCTTRLRSLTRACALEHARFSAVFAWM